MMHKVGLTSTEIECTNVGDVVDREWLKEIAWQLAKLREGLDGATLRTCYVEDHDITLHLK